MPAPFEIYPANVTQHETTKGLPVIPFRWIGYSIGLCAEAAADLWFGWRLPSDNLVGQAGTAPSV